MTSGSLWVVTSYFNPAGYKKRLANFRAFRRLLHAPLMAVELAKPGAHELRQDDADVVVSLTGENRMWQQERLVTLGIGRLPKHVRYVAYTDCDVIFDDPDWVERAMRELDAGGGMLQLFDFLAHLPRTIDPSTVTVEDCRNAVPLFTAVSVASALRTGAFDGAVGKWKQAQSAPDAETYHKTIDGGPSYGMAWAVQRDVVEACGLFDKAIVGIGNFLQVWAALGKLEEYVATRNPPAGYRAALFAWADRARSAGLFRRIAALDQKAYHLWHGDVANRAYFTRHQILSRHDYAPDKHIRLAENGTWAWTDPSGAFAAEVEAYFRSRREDGGT